MCIGFLWCIITPYQSFVDRSIEAWVGYYHEAACYQWRDGLVKSYDFVRSEEAQFFSTTVSGSTTSASTSSFRWDNPPNADPAAPVCFYLDVASWLPRIKATDCDDSTTRKLVCHKETGQYSKTIWSQNSQKRPVKLWNAIIAWVCLGIPTKCFVRFSPILSTIHFLHIIVVVSVQAKSKLFVSFSVKLFIYCPF